MIVVIQLMVLFDVIHVVNNKSSEASDKSFLYTALEVFCLCECSCMSMIDRMTQSEVALRCHKFKIEIRSLHFALNIWWRNRISIFSFADESVSHESKNFNDSPERSRCQICLPRESTPRYALCSEFVMNGSASRSNSPTFHHFIYHSRHKYLDCVQWRVFGERNG